jgi:twitching motility two-component system response regulator PilH
LEARKVLVVDDSPTDLHLISGYLADNGYIATSASSGEEALIKVYVDRPDLILMDIVMPGMNGYETTRALCKNPDTASIPVMIISSKGQDTDKIWGMRQGARGYLVKPIVEETLIRKIRAL